MNVCSAFSRLIGSGDRAAEQLRRLPLENGNAGMAVGYTLMKSGRSREAAEFAAQVGVPDHRRFLALAGAGRPAEAVALLDAASYTRTIGQFLLFLPGLDPVRDDPRFVAALATLGLTEAHARAQAWRKAHPSEKAAR